MKKILILFLAIVVGTASAVPFLHVAYAAGFDFDFPMIPSSWEDEIPDELLPYYHSLQDRYNDLCNAILDVSVDAALKDEEWVIDLIEYTNQFYNTIKWFHDDYSQSYSGHYSSITLPPKPESYSDWHLHSNRLIYTKPGIYVYDGNTQISAGSYIASSDLLENLVDPYLSFRYSFTSVFESDRFNTKPYVYIAEYHIGNRYTAAAWIYVPHESHISDLRIRCYRNGFTFAIDPVENKPCLINVISPMNDWSWFASVDYSISDSDSNEITIFPDGSSASYTIKNDNRDSYWLGIDNVYDVWQYIPLVTIYDNNDSSQDSFHDIHGSFPVPPELKFPERVPDPYKIIITQSQQQYKAIEDLLLPYAAVHPIDLDQFKYGILAFPFDFVSDFHAAIIDGYSPTFRLDIDSFDIMGYHIWDSMTFELDPRSLFGSDLWVFISYLFVFVLSANLIFTTFRKFFGGDTE